MVQTGKGGGGLGGMLGGGSSGSVFGASTADVMTKITRGSAVVFVILALLLSFLFAKKDDTLIPENTMTPSLEALPESGDAPAEKSEGNPEPSNPIGE